MTEGTTYRTRDDAVKAADEAARFVFDENTNIIEDMHILRVGRRYGFVPAYYSLAQTEELYPSFSRVGLLHGDHTFESFSGK